MLRNREQCFEPLQFSYGSFNPLSKGSGIYAAFLLGFLRMPGEAEPGLSEVNLPMALQVIPVPATALSEDPE
jgi:hypothetical protein